MTDTTATRLTAPERYVIKLGNAYFAHIDWDEDNPVKAYVGTPNRDQAMTYGTADEARVMAEEQTRYFKGVRIVRLPAEYETTITEAGRAAVAARRAARKAERGW